MQQSNDRVLRANAISGFAEDLAWTDIVKPELDKQVALLYQMLKEQALNGHTHNTWVLAGRIEGVEMVLKLFGKAISDYERVKPILDEIAEFPTEKIL